MKKNVLHRRIFPVALPVLAVAFVSSAQAQPPGGAATPGVAIAFDKSGLSALANNHVPFLRSGALEVTEAQMRRWDGETVAADTKPVQTRVDAKQRIVTQIYAWGTIRCTYSVPATNDRLNLSVTITNTSQSVLGGVSLRLMEIALPAPVKEGAGQTGANVGAPTILSCDWGSGALAFCNEDVGRPLYAAALKGADSRTLTLHAATFRDERFPKGWLSTPKIERPIYPGQEDKFTLSLRFGTANHLADDMYRRFADAYPFTLKWEDHRPIGMLMLSTSEYDWPTNPRGWFNGDKTVDVTSEAGRAAFGKRLMDYADNAVRILKAMNAQGMIVWDVEGQEHPHATSYLGDPRALPPEMEPLADAFFKKFTDAGLRTGICIRPQMPVRRIYGEGAWQMQQDDPAYVLGDKIATAKKRWNCTIFYVDSNVRFDPRFQPSDGAGYELLDAAIFRAVARAHPDALIIPEHENTLYHAFTAPYNELRGGFASTPEPVRRVYPNAFNVLAIADGPMDERRDELIAAVRRGDILLFRAWFDDVFNAKVKSIYAEAGRAAAAGRNGNKK